PGLRGAPDGAARGGDHLRLRRRAAGDPPGPAPGHRSRVSPHSSSDSEKRQGDDKKKNEKIGTPWSRSTLPRGRRQRARRRPQGRVLRGRGPQRAAARGPGGRPVHGRAGGGEGQPTGCARALGDPPAGEVRPRSSTQALGYPLVGEVRPWGSTRALGPPG